MQDTTIRVGVQEGSGSYDDGSTIAEIAFYNEFGTARIPERSFIRSTFFDSKEAMIDRVNKEAQKVLTFKQDVKTAADRIGIFAQGEIKKKFRDNDWVENAPLTVALKGSSTPLIDTGQLIGSITWEVKK